MRRTRLYRNRHHPKFSDVNCMAQIQRIEWLFQNIWWWHAMPSNGSSGVTSLEIGHKSRGRMPSQYTRKCGFAQRTPTEAYHVHCLPPTVQHGKGSMMWDAMSHRGPLVSMHGYIKKPWWSYPDLYISCLIQAVIQTNGGTVPY